MVRGMREVTVEAAEMLRGVIVETAEAPQARRIAAERIAEVLQVAMAEAMPIAVAREVTAEALQAAVGREITIEELLITVVLVAMAEVMPIAVAREVTEEALQAAVDPGITIEVLRIAVVLVAMAEAIQIVVAREVMAVVLVAMAEAMQIAEAREDTVEEPQAQEPQAQAQAQAPQAIRIAPETAGTATTARAKVIVPAQATNQPPRTNASFLSFCGRQATAPAPGSKQKSETPGTARPQNSRAGRNPRDRPRLLGARLGVRNVRAPHCHMSRVSLQTQTRPESSAQQSGVEQAIPNRLIAKMHASQRWKFRRGCLGMC
jgi:hypothetical protein